MVCGKGDVRLRSDRIAISHRGTTKGKDLTRMGAICDSDQIASAKNKERKEAAGMDAICDMIASQRGKTRIEGLRECKEV